MEEMQIGAFIRDRRLQLEMTQQQLADKLGVTDKAVSKWERSVSCPDITILRALADALEVSVSELLAGQREPAAPVPPEVENTVLDTVSYAETARKKNGGWKFVMFLVLTICCAIGALVCLILYFAIASARPAMRIAIRSIALGWAVCYPLLRVERYPVRRSLTILSLALLPYLASLHLMLVLNPRLLAIELLSLVFLWAVYFICAKYRRQKLLSTGWILLLGGLLSMAIALLVSGNFSNFISGIALLAAGTGVLLGGVWRRRPPPRYS